MTLHCPASKDTFGFFLKIVKIQMSVETLKIKKIFFVARCSCFEIWNLKFEISKIELFPLNSYDFSERLILDWITRISTFRRLTLKFNKAGKKIVERVKGESL